MSAAGSNRDGPTTSIAHEETGEDYLAPNQLEKQYHPTPEQLKVRKARHRRSGSQGSGNTIQMQGCSPRISPLRERRVCNFIIYCRYILLAQIICQAYLLFQSS